MADPRLLEAYLRMSPEEAKRRESEQMREWLRGQQAVREEKRGETLGLGDLLFAAKPAMTGGTALADILDRIRFEGPKGTPPNRDQGESVSVVPPAVKLQRKVIQARTPIRETPRRELIPERLYKNYGEEKFGEKFYDGNHYWGTPKEVDRYEFLVNGWPKAGISLPHNRVWQYPRASPLAHVDVAGRPDLATKQLNSQRHEAYRTAMEQAQNEPRMPFPEFPDWIPVKEKATFDPASIKAATRMIKAIRPRYEEIGGDRITGIHDLVKHRKPDQSNFTQIPLPRLSETAAQKERSQLSRYLQEIISERAANRKTKTAGR